jgi:hypothetical protein
MATVEEIIELIGVKCREIKARTEFILTTANRTSDPMYVEGDPDYDDMKSQLHTHAAKLIALAQELEALIP